MLSQNQIALLINTFSQLTTNTNYVTTTRINASYKTTQSFNYEGNTVKPLLDIYSGNQVVILKDTSTGKYYAIREDFDPVLNERTFTRKYREERKKIVKQEADVAVLLCCEKNDTYEFWVTWLGNRRKNRFAYVGELPKRLQTEQYWAWESNSGGRFEFHPYAGATGGGISISTTPTNHDGAAIGAGAQGAYFQSEGWRGGGDGPVENIKNVADIPGGDLGGIVTPKWDKVLTDYEVTARTYLQTLCYPLGMYTDVTWEWSDGGGGYALRKVAGDGVTTESSDDVLSTKWRVDWSYAGGGGSVTINQNPPPNVYTFDETAILYTLTWNNGSRSLQGYDLTYTVTKVVSETAQPLIDSYSQSWDGYSITTEEFTITAPDSISDWSQVESYLTFGVWDDYGSVGSYTTGPGLVRRYRGSIKVGDGLSLSGTVTNVLPHQFYVYLNLVWVGYPPEWNLKVYSEGILVLDETYPTDPLPSEDSVLTGGYLIRVYDQDGIEVASDSASTPIAHSSTKIETKRVSFYIKQDGENINGQFDSSIGLVPDGFEDGDDAPEEYRNFEVESGESVPTVTGETRLVIARIDAWVEVAGKKLAAVTLNGKDGQAIIESPQYEQATTPYKGPGGRTVYPCYPQKTEDPPKEESAKFKASDGFNAYHVTWYNTREDSIGGKTTDYVPFDFNNPGLSGYLPSPAINYLYSLVSTDLEINFEVKGRISWGKDIPEEDLEAGQTTNLEEETEEGVDPYGVVYPLVFGFTYALYGPIKVSNILLSQLVDKDNDETLLSKYKKQYWEARARSRKPRLYALAPDNYKDGQPFEEFDYSDLNQRGLNRLEGTMSSQFRRNLWGYDLSPIGNESNEDWAEERVTFAADPSGGDTPFERQYLNDETANSSTVKQPGDKTVDITVKMADVEALLKKDKKGEVEFTIHDSQQSSKTTTQVFKMNPIRDVFEGYEDVKILAVAGVIY